jgi:hypothetical protein
MLSPETMVIDHPIYEQDEDMLKPWIDSHRLKLIHGTWYKDRRRVVTGGLHNKRTIIRAHHDPPVYRHPGINRSIQLTSRHYWWPKIRQDVHDYIKGCADCQRNKINTHPIRAPLQPIYPKPEALPFETIALDFITKLPESEGSDSILTVVDHDCTKAAIFIPCREEITAEETVGLYVRHVFTRYGLPSRIISDRDPRFASKFTRELCCILGISQNISTAYHPRTDGQSEAKNKWVKQHLRFYVNHYQKNWTYYLPMAEFAHNTWASETTRESPFTLLMGYNPRADWIDRPSPIPQVALRIQQFKEAREHAQQSMIKAQKSWVKHKDTPKFQSGDLVWLEGKNLRTVQPTAKLAPKRHGLFKVTQVMSAVNYCLELPTQWSIHPVFHIDLLTPYHETPIHGANYQCLDSSAPGNSGIAWWIIKLGWKVAGEHIQWVLNGSLSLGIHPDHWKTATVVVIPKPNRADYFTAKNFRPISLLECLSKLLEKAVSKRLLFAIDKYELIPTTQFGTRAFSSMLDAGLTLMHNVQAAMRRKEKVGILLFDIKGFFDHVKRDRLKGIMENLGFPREYCEWAHSFLSDRKVRLSFNNFTSDEMGQLVGTPQGSPVSPVLSAIYTSALLRLQDHWNNSTLGMYVDDGVILAHADDWESVDRLLIARYRRCEEWLRRSNLAIEPDKTEVLYFRTPRQRLDFPPNRICLPNPSENTSYAVQASDTVCYLGFFINHKLDWEPHVTIMCNRARASIKALQVLGSSHCGLSMANWRLVFNAVCLPVLSYGCQLWANSPKIVSLMKKVQLVFNEGVKVISGAFRTAPREPLHEILWVLPTRHFLEKLIHTSALRLYRVPRGSQLLSCLGHEWDSSVQTGTDWVLPGPLASTSRNGSGRSKQRPTALEALGARVPAEAPRTDVVAVAPWEVPDWGARCQLMGTSHPKQRKEWVDGLYSTITPSSGAIIRVVSTVSNKGRPDNRVVGAAAAVLTQGGDRAEMERSWCMGVEVTQFDVDVFALAKTAEWLASYYTTVVPPTDIYLLSGNHSALQFITKADSLVNQRAALLFKDALTKFFSSQENWDTRFHLVWAPVSRKRAQDNKARAKVMEAIQVAPLAGLNRVQSAAFLKRVARQRAYNNWLSEWNAERESRRRSNKPDHFAYGWSLITPPDGKNNPIWRGIVTIPAKSKGKIPAPSRHTTSTLLRFVVGHGFFSDYSTRFRKDLPDESHFCPCGTAPRTMMHLIYDCPRFQHIRNQRDFQVIDNYTSPDTFFTDPDVALIFAKFLSEGRVGFKPEEGPIVEFGDGRPSASSSRPRRPVPGGSAVPADPPEVMVSAPSLDSSAPFDPG